MLYPICFYNSKVFVPFPDATLKSFAYSNVRNSRNFKECYKLKIPFPAKNIFFGVVENYVLGLKCMIVLVVNFSNKISVFKYCESIRNRLFHVRDLKWPGIRDIGPNSNLFITNGPTAILLSDVTLQVFTLSHNTKTSLQLNSFIPTGHKVINVLQAETVGQLFIVDWINVILIVFECQNSANETEIQAIACGIYAKQDNGSVMCNILSVDVFIPKCFQSSVEALHICDTSITKQAISSFYELDWTDNCSYLCTQTECLVFVKGVLTYCSHLPVPNILCIKTDFCDVASQVINLVLITRTEDIFFLTKKNPHESSCRLLQLCKSWSGIKSLIIGDILKKGSKQLLLLKEVFWDAWEEGCILAEISCFKPVDIVSQNTDPAMNQAIPGMKAKVENGKLSIAKAESKIFQKMEATLDAIFRMKENGSENEHVDHHICSFQESLLNVLLQKDENHSPSNHAFKRTVTLTVENHWKKLIDNRLVLCWTFYNNDVSTIYNLYVCIGIQNSHTECIQRVFVQRSHSISIEDEFRKQINPRERFSVVSSLEVPSEGVEAAVVLSWYVGTSTQFENELLLPAREKTLKQQQMLLPAVWSASDVLGAKPTDILSAEDLICFKVLQQRTVLVISALYSESHDFASSLLSSAVGKRHLLLLEGCDKKCLVFKSANFPLYGVHISFKPLNQKTVEIEAFTKNVKEMHLLVQFLYGALPEDMLILPSAVTSLESDLLKQQVVCAMKYEVDLLFSTFNIHNLSDQIERNHPEIPLAPGTVVIPKENYMRLKKVLVKKECITDKLMQNLTIASALKSA